MTRHRQLMTVATACFVVDKKEMDEGIEREKYSNAATSCDSKSYIDKKIKHFKSPTHIKFLQY